MDKETEIPLEGFTAIVTREGEQLILLLSSDDWLDMSICSAVLTPAQALELAEELTKYTNNGGLK